MTVGQRMIKNPITVTPETPVSDAQYMMRKEKVHRFPVIGKDGRMKGIVTEKDLLYATPSPATTLDVYEMNYLLSKLTVDEVMSTDVITVTEDTTVEEAARILVDNKACGYHHRKRPVQSLPRNVRFPSERSAHHHRGSRTEG